MSTCQRDQFLPSRMKTKLEDKHFRSLWNNGDQFGLGEKAVLAPRRPTLHRVIYVENNSTPSISNNPTLQRDLPAIDSAVTPQKTRTIFFEAKSRWSRTNASAAEVSTPYTNDKSTTKNRKGFRSQEGPSTSFRMVSST